MSSSATQSPPSHLTTLPGELRNQIFTLCINRALNHHLYHPLTLASSPFTTSVYSPTAKTGHLKLSNIGPLPLLFTNKQIFAEVSSLLYGRVEHVSIDEQVGVWLDDDASSRWEFAYSLLQGRADLMKVVKSVEITLPRTPRPFLLAAYASMTRTPLPKNTTLESSALAILPGLETFLVQFENLERVKIVLVAESTDQIPVYEEFRGLWKLFGERLKVECKTRMEIGPPNRQVAPLAIIHGHRQKWQDGWMRYVRGLKERVVEE